jgi:uncharacterized protein
MITESKIRRHPERAVPEQAPEILAQGFIAHVGFCQEGNPYVLPFSYYYDPNNPNRLYLHGSVASRTLQHLATGAPVCVEVTLLDGLVYSKSAKYHSMNYRSVVCFGTTHVISKDSEKTQIFEQAIQRYFPGRTEGQDYEGPSVAHLTQTTLLEVRIKEWSAKARDGGPKGPQDADPDAPGTAGVVKLPSDRPSGSSLHS